LTAKLSVGNIPSVPGFFPGFSGFSIVGSEAHMALKHILFNRVRSDKGFTVKLRVFRGFAEYREGNHVARVPVYPVIGESLVRVFEATPLAWNAPYSAETIREEKRQEILQGVVDALRFRRCRVEMVRS
jgi:hypothetical protein